MACFRVSSSVAPMVVITICSCSKLSMKVVKSSVPQDAQRQCIFHVIEWRRSPLAEPLELEECSKELLEVSRNNTVEVTNTWIDCVVCDVHVACGDFASNDVIDPDKFHRLIFYDCLVNGGGSTKPSFPVSFQYGNSFPYPTTVAPASCD
ncbi:hypothetical protein VPH35_108216 [Triticum aestivum]